MSRRPATKTVALLKAARARIADPARWTQYTPARRLSWAGEVGPACEPFDPRAVSWCAVGALMVERRAAGLSHAVLGRAYRRLTGPTDERGPAPIEYVNDCLGHDAVLEAFDAAIREK